MIGTPLQQGFESPPCISNSLCMSHLKANDLVLSLNSLVRGIELLQEFVDHVIPCSNGPRCQALKPILCCVFQRKRKQPQSDLIIRHSIHLRRVADLNELGNMLVGVI